MRISVKLDVDDVTHRLKRLGSAGQKVAKEVLVLKVAEIASLARPLTPVDPEGGGSLRASVRPTRAGVSRGGVVTAAAVAGGSALIGLKTGGSRNQSAHVRAFRAAMLKSRAYSIYAAVQEKGSERTRGGGVVTLHHTTGQSHFMQTAGDKVAVTVPDALLARLDREAEA